MHIGTFWSSKNERKRAHMRQHAQKDPFLHLFFYIIFLLLGNILKPEEFQEYLDSMQVPDGSDMSSDEEETNLEGEEEPENHSFSRFLSGVDYDEPIFEYLDVFPIDSPIPMGSNVPSASGSNLPSSSGFHLPSPSGSNFNAPSPGNFNELSPLGLDLISPVPSHSADGQPKKISSTKKATRRKLAYKPVSKFSPVKAKNKNPPSKIWFPGKDNKLSANIPQFIHSPQNNDH